MTTKLEKSEKDQAGTGVAPVVKQVSAADRFTERILKELTDTSGDIQITDYQRKLCQNYFIKIDSMLKVNETKRMAKSESDRELLPYVWESVNMTKLAQDLRGYSSLGLDPLQKNHINIIPYPNKHTGLIDLGFLEGYRGIELKAMKYGFNKPDDVIVRLVYSNQFFRPIFKDFENKVESFEFRPSENPFEIGELLGGFYFHQYYDKPEKNKIVVFTKKDIDKRKPEYASSEFWGGSKKVKTWVDNPKQPGKKMPKEEFIEVEGWYDEMAYKTIYRAAFDDITIDSKLIDDNFVAMMEAQNTPLLTESYQVSDTVKETINTKGNKEKLSFDKVDEAEVEHQGNEEKPIFTAPEDEAPTDVLATVGQDLAAKEAEENGESEETPAPSFGTSLFDKK